MDNMSVLIQSAGALTFYSEEFCIEFRIEKDMSASEATISMHLCLLEINQSAAILSGGVLCCLRSCGSNFQTVHQL